MSKPLKHSPAIILAEADALEAMVDTLPQIGGKDIGAHMASHLRHRAECEIMAERLMRRESPRTTISEGSDGWRISMMGIRASSTSGFRAAARNWITQARRKADAAG